MTSAETIQANVQLSIENVDPDRVRRIVDHVERVMQVRFEEPIGAEIRCMLESLVVAILATEPCLCETVKGVMASGKDGVLRPTDLKVVAPLCPVHGRPTT